jgi:GNAT superfamily N-acetyltransferase
MAEQEELVPGLRSQERGSPCMTLALDTADAGLLDRVPDGLSIRPVETDAELDVFTKTLGQAMGIPAPRASAWGDATRLNGIDAAPWRAYVGWLGDEPVATNMLFLGAGVASVYGVATLPEHRGKGIGGAITLAPLLEARDGGLAWAVLFSSLEGIHAYERIGFRQADLWIDRYLWQRHEGSPVEPEPSGP